MQVSKVALFGGALLAAGISTGTANAQNFVFQDAGTYAGSPYNSFSRVRGVYDFFTEAISVISNYDSPGANLTQSITAYGTTANAVQTNNQLRVDGTWDGTPTGVTYGGVGVGYGGGFLQSFFQVDQDAQLRITWDVTDTDSFGDTIFFIDDGVSTLSIDPGADGTGDILIDVFAGVDYGINIGMDSVYLLTAGVTSFINVELVPAPGAAALAGLAGLAAVRRRR